MDRVELVETDDEVDIEAGVSNGRTERNLNKGWTGNFSINGSEKIDDGGDDNDDDDDDMNYGLLREKRCQSLDLSEKKCENVKLKKFRKSSKPPRPPKGPSISANDEKMMREIAELAMRKRARIERMKTLRRMKAAKSSSSSSSSPCSSIFAMIVTILFFLFLIFQGFSRSNGSLRSDGSPAPTVSGRDRLISVQFYNEFAPREKIDPTPSTSFRFVGKGIAGADNEEKARVVTR